MPDVISIRAAAMRFYGVRNRDAAYRLARNGAFCLLQIGRRRFVSVPATRKMIESAKPANDGRPRSGSES